jgi:hypothetical protein
MVGKGSIPDSLRFALPLVAAVGLAATALAVAAAGPAAARTFKPPHHRIFHGVSDTTNNAEFRSFKRQVGAHPATLEDFYHWDTPLTTGALQRWNQTDTRGVLSLSTAPGGQPERISPRKIANGHGDHYILRLNESIAASHQVVYIRLFPEMNGSWNPYCAFSASGSSKGRSHATHNFRKAWQRIALIVRGGRRSAINQALRHHRMPRILRASSGHDPVYDQEGVGGRLDRPKVSFIWVPQTTGSPNIPGNQPRDYWPGKRFVDWVGADIYSAYASAALPKLKSFYRHWDHFPFMVGEYSPWNNDYSGHFTRQLFHWAESHGRARMLIYYRSVTAGSPYDINHWAKARGVLRHELNKRRFDAYAPHTRH